MHWHKDTVHDPISIALKMAGCAVLDLSKHGDGAPDDLAIRGNENSAIVRLFEYKSGVKVNHRKKGNPYTPAQIEWQRRNPRLMKYYRTVDTKEQALKEMGLL